jgi:hypothetical protein
MAKAIKTRAMIPEPSFRFFVWAAGVMLSLIAAAATYFSLT